MNSDKDLDKPLLLDIGCGKNKLSRAGYKIIGTYKKIWENIWIKINEYIFPAF